MAAGKEWPPLQSSQLFFAFPIELPCYTLQGPFRGLISQVFILAVLLSTGFSLLWWAYMVWGLPSVGLA